MNLLTTSEVLWAGCKEKAKNLDFRIAPVQFLYRAIKPIGDENSKLYVINETNSTDDGGLAMG